VAAVGLLIAGAVVGAFVIFGPSRNRMRSLQEAARALGSGQGSGRAVDTGGDEVALLARTFNEMAGSLEQRTQALLAADESRRRLLADVSHELMTPLAAIRGYVETMAMPGMKIDDAARGTWASSPTRPNAWSTSSAISSTWRALRAAGVRGSATRCRSSRSSSACCIATIHS
jgi:signal transduction histidine kinase